MTAASLGLVVIRESWAHLRIANPAVAWLCARGEMVAATQAHQQAMGFWLMGSLAAETGAGRRSAYFADELELEGRRTSNYTMVISRLSGIYLFADERSARSACARWRGFEERHLVEVGILDGSRMSQHDAEWISNHLGRGGGSVWMDSYLAGQDTADPIQEILVDGRAVIYGTDLREQAYEVVRRTWPRSIPLLDISRIAAELGADLGLIALMVHADGADLRVDFHLSMEAADDPNFLDRLKDYDGPRNYPPNPELVLPDLRAQGFVLPGAATSGPTRAR